MKVVHINTWDTGGAANAAIRIYRAQKKDGLDVSFLCLKNEANLEDITYFSNFLQSKYGSWGTKLLRYSNRIYNLLPIGFDTKIFFNRPDSLFRVQEHPLIQSADLIHIHSGVKFIDTKTFFPKINQPIIWTLHDMNPFSGGKHYEGMMKKKLRSLEEKFIEQKIKATQNSRIFAVSPSSWLMQLSKESKSFKRFKNYNIPNCINIEKFQTSKAFTKTSNQKILFVAQNVNDKRKGFSYLLEAIDHINEQVEIWVLGNAKKEDFSNKKNIKLLGFVSSQEKLAEIYTEADIYVIPSTEDNLPNTIVESHICGTPVVGFDLTGVSTMIENQITGILVKEITGIALAKGITKALKMVEENKFSSEFIMQTSRKKYAEKTVIDAYFSVYSEALGL